MCSIIDADETVKILKNHKFLCENDRECMGMDLFCGQSLDCHIQCTGYLACAYSTIICPLAPHLCNISIQNYANYLKVDGSNSGDLILHSIVGYAQEYLMPSEIYCPNNASCM